MTPLTDIIAELQRAQAQFDIAEHAFQMARYELNLALTRLGVESKKLTGKEGSPFDVEVPMPTLASRLRASVLDTPAPYTPTVEVVTPAPAPVEEPLIVTEEWTRTMDLLLNGTDPLFVTGGAGVGKSTMLEQFVREYPGNLAVVAPTGVAALRVNGSTIHRLFKFGAHALDKDDIYRITDEKHRYIFEHMDTLLIDEVSMCRADLMDAIDLFLRRNRTGKDKSPFGGVRIIMFGDPFQLPPVAREKDERKWLKQRYGTDMAFFFHAECWRDAQPKICELTTIFRQKDANFASALNAVRKGSLTPEQMLLINSRVQPLFKPPTEGDLWLTLTTTNASADNANQAMLRSLPGVPKTFLADVVGDFDLKNAPTDEALQLKVGTAVMFVRNDNIHHRWVNGTLGKVTNVEPLWVKTNRGEHMVERDEWETITYNYDEKTKKLTKEVKGKFVQVPLRHASAITIHKSQGQSYDHCIIDMAGGAFASGQAYVSLSRCRTLEGMVLRKPLQDRDLMVDEEVKKFMAGEKIARPEVAQEQLL